MLLNYLILFVLVIGIPLNSLLSAFGLRLAPLEPLDLTNSIYCGTITIILITASVVMCFF